MSPSTTTPQEDLAFLRRVVEGGESGQRQFGQICLVAGLLYGLQCLGHWAQAAGWLAMDKLQETIFATAFTAVFVGYLVHLRRSGATPAPTGVVARAVTTAFAAAGTTNCIMVIVFCIAAARQSDPTLWYLYPCMVVALQGGAWLTAYALRREVWQALVGLGGMATSIAMALAIGTPTYLLILAIALFVLLAGAGALMMGKARGTA